MSTDARIHVALNRVLNEVCPIHGVSIGRKDDKATWRIDFKDEATAGQRADGRAALNAFDVAAHDALEASEAVRTATVDAAIKADNVIQQMKAMTPAEYDDWWTANVTTAAQAIGVLKRVVRVLVRRVL